MLWICSHCCSHSGKSLLKVLQKGVVLLVYFFFCFVPLFSISQRHCLDFAQVLIYLFFLLKYSVICAFCSSIQLVLMNNVGILEANFIEPAHDKQDFERSSLFIRLETRLKQMVNDYWWVTCVYFHQIHDNFDSNIQSLVLLVGSLNFHFSDLTIEFF